MTLEEGDCACPDRGGDSYGDSGAQLPSPESVELWLVRHGETTASASRTFAGWSDPPLTDTGRRQAAAVAPLLDGHHFDTVWSSDLQRAIATSRLAWGEARQDARLREVSFGDLEGTRFEDLEPDLARQLVEFRCFDLPGGETHRDARSRVESFIAELNPGRHLLFVHGGVIRLLAQDLGLDRFVTTGTVVAIDWTRRELLWTREADGEPVLPASE